MLCRVKFLVKLDGDDEYVEHNTGNATSLYTLLNF